MDKQPLRAPEVDLISPKEKLWHLEIRDKEGRLEQNFSMPSYNTSDGINMIQLYTLELGGWMTKFL